ncbi:hypothetical protein AYO46_00325 [Betaproteobacteria bacterium SCGC AG-212-J23]|nr:hypothetical protein AYO46_00325 [Betaproteobacteria bacterium SCGC AG-212-J23]
MKALLLLLALAVEPDLEALVERFYLGAKVALAENAACLEGDQQAWQRSLDACKDAACSSRSRLERLATLQALQESVPSGLDLPEVPQLLWTIAPAEHAGTRGTTLQVEGRLEYGGGGYSLRRDDGNTTLLVDDLSLRGASAEQMPEIRNASRGARMMARGIAGDGGEKAGFDRRSCVFLYVLP